MNSIKFESRIGKGEATVRQFLGGFTLIELLVVTGTVALLLMVVTPAFSRMKPNGHAVRCLNNMRQLALAWQMYADDNNGKIVVNLQGAAAMGGAGDPNYGQGWASGWMDWSPLPDNTNTIFLTNPRYARLAPYLNGTTNVFKCPADRYLSSPQQAMRWSQRARSYCANIYLGAGNAEQGPTDPLYKHIFRISEMLYPTPAQTWVYLEEHPDSINDPAFFSPHQAAWIDFPATHHNGAGAFSFADGHAELHRWTGSLTRLASVSFISFPVITALPNDQDLRWVSYHSERYSPTSY